MTRECLPNRRRTWTQKIYITEKDGKQHTFYLSFGEYNDGRLGEIWIEASKEGTFLRGVLGALAKQVSLSLQCGVDVSEIVKLLQGMDYPPGGKVSGLEGGSVVTECTSVSDWIAQEIDHWYLIKSKHPERIR